jgi:hypothetical protein
MRRFEALAKHIEIKDLPDKDRFHRLRSEKNTSSTPPPGFCARTPTLGKKVENLDPGQ